MVFLRFCRAGMVRALLCAKQSAKWLLFSPVATVSHWLANLPETWKKCRLWYHFNAVYSSAADAFGVWFPGLFRTSVLARLSRHLPYLLASSAAFLWGCARGAGGKAMVLGDAAWHAGGGQPQLGGFHPPDLVAQPRGLLEFQIAGGLAH